MSSRKRTATQAMGPRELVRNIKKQKNSELDDFLVIGIDFGTTYSGVSWATVADFEETQINLITTWPGTGREESKVPSEIYYEGHRVMWGFSVPANAEPLRWFKLLLLRDADLTSELKRSNILARGNTILTEKKKTATDVIGDYLRGLWKHTVSTIERARSKAVVDALKFHVVITVPAIWPDYARQDMMDAARKAGIFDPRPGGATSLEFAPEPETAALATLCDRGPDLRVGDVYMICDAGGGTVDLISYKVNSINPIQLHEAVIGTGGLCGGIFIDETFEAICKSRLGRRWRNLSQAGIKDIMKHEWESGVKPQFTPDDPEMEYIIGVPAEAFTGKGMLGLNDESRKPHIKNGRIHFSRLDIQAAFDGAFHDILELVNSQIKEAGKKGLAVKGVILVGGLGSSPYLYQYLETKFATEGIAILQATGVRPRTAICRGAIFKGFMSGPRSSVNGAPSQIPARIAVVSSIARKSLGIKFMEEFDESVHLLEERVWKMNEGFWAAENQMQWYLTKGTDVSRKNAVRHGFYRVYNDRAQFEAADLSVSILECDLDVPPSRHTASVRKLCNIKITLADIKYDTLENCVGRTGQRMKKWSYELEMVPSGASTEFAVYYKGDKVGSQNVAIEFQ